MNGSSSPMRRRHCNYSLWNIAARQCPECGGAFAPTESEFVPGTVAFCCPHCDRAYLASHDSGHLDPPAFRV